MNNKEIENLKLALLNLARQGCRIKVASAGVEGRIVGVGFKPYWTGPYDSKIDRLEINYIDDLGNIRSYYLNFITDYDVVSNDGRGFDSMKNACIDIHQFSVLNERRKKQPDKVRIEICQDENK